MCKLTSALTFAGLAITLTTTSLAQQATDNAISSAVLSEVYGRGVHQFFSCQHHEAFQTFSLAIDAGTEDPRPYFFRGITSAVMGDMGSAETDWRIGAEKELASANAGLVGPALRRIQGPIRICLEKIRQQVRLEQRNNTRARGLNRAEEMKQIESKILRDRSAAPPAVNPFQREGSATSEGTPKVETTDPFKDDPSNALDVPAPDGFGGANEAPSDAMPGSSGDLFPPAGDAPSADGFGTPPSTPPNNDPFGSF